MPLQRFPNQISESRICGEYFRNLSCGECYIHIRDISYDFMWYTFFFYWFIWSHILIGSSFQHKLQPCFGVRPDPGGHPRGTPSSKKNWYQLIIKKILEKSILRVGPDPGHHLGYPRGAPRKIWKKNLSKKIERAFF